MTPQVDRAALSERLEGRVVVASISGGKDSAAMSLWLKEQEIEHRRVFMDTGWEHAKTYAYLRGPLTAALGPIEEISGPKKMEALVRSKGMFPSRMRRFCTQELKIKPMQEYLHQFEDGEAVNAVGIRRAESAARAQMEEWEWSEGFDCETWRPLVMWSEQDVVDIHARHGLRPNPLYLEGAKRVGCWPCIMASKEEIRHIAEVDPGQIVRIRKLERAVGKAAQARATVAGRVLENGPTWFQAPVRNAEGKRPCTPIDKVVEWSRTSRGGRQFELFAAGPSDAGCMRWGLCDTNSD